MPAMRPGRPRSERLHKSILQTAFDQVLEVGFREVSIESIAAKAGVGKTTIYRRWPNKAAVVMDAFMMRVGAETLFPRADKLTDSIRLQMRTMAKAFRGRDGALVKALLSEAQFDAELATAFRERWTLPATIDLLYAPMYYRLQMGTGPLSDAYIDGIFDHAMAGLLPRKEAMPTAR